MDYKLLKELCLASGVSGYESGVLSLIAQKILPFSDSVEYDRCGNLIAFKKGTKGALSKTILYSCHADEVGFVINHVDAEGRLLFDAIGMDSLVYAGRRVLVGENLIPGIIAVKPFHLVSTEERNKRIDTDKLYIDIGAKTKEQVQKLGVFANYAVFDTDFCEFGDDMIKTKALDDRIGCAMLIEQMKKGVEYDSYFAFCVGEEIGLRGSKTVAQRICPDICINLECTTAGDIYGVEGDARTCLVGGGAVVPFMDGSAVYTPSLYKKVREIAEKNKIACQTKTKVAGGTDAGSYTRTCGGTKIVGLALPTRYIHSSSCVASKKDIESTKKLLFAVTDNIKELSQIK